TVLSGWVLGAGFVVGVSCWFLFRKSNVAFATDSIRIASWVGLVGILLTMWTGDGSAVQVSRVQPMKLAAMEGLYNGSRGQGLVGLGILDPAKERGDGRDPMLLGFEIPKALSILAKHDPDAFVPGIDDLIEGVELNEAGDTVRTVSYYERIERGRAAQQALRDYDAASKAGDAAGMTEAENRLKADFRYFGYGYLSSPDEAVPPVAVTFYAFRVMVICGGYFLLFFIAMLFLGYRKPAHLENRWVLFFGILTIPLVWIASEAGWVVAEVGRQPWVIEGLLPTRAAVSSISAGLVKLTFWLFAIVFAGLLTAEISILCKEIRKAAGRDILADDNH
ncbi:MAG: cytochrome ubiquinol oxidase subunit I, partial [Muribaculaceae bacterium]|nr:cytochrome ubiquinol oxidase subunit I [Muribaculaceae bacterium]